MLPVRSLVVFASIAFLGSSTVPLASAQDATPPADLKVVSTFEGDRGPGFKAGANVMGGVGPNHVVDFTIVGFTVHDKTTGRVLRRLTQHEFWSQIQPVDSFHPREHANDPWIVYDPTSERWFAAVAGTAPGDCFLAVSSSRDPMQPWNGTLLPLPTHDPGMKIGVDKSGLYVSCSNVLPDGSAAIELYVLPKADAVSEGGPILANAQTFSNLVYAAFPAVDFDRLKKPSSPAALLSNEFGGPTCSKLYLYRLDWSDSKANLSDVQTILLSRSYEVPRMEGAQPNGGVRLAQAGGRRNNCAFVHAGSVFGCNGAQRTPDSRPGILWYEVRIRDGALLQEGFVDSPHCDYLYPSLAVDSLGNVGIGCTRTSENEFPSVCAMLHADGDPPGSMRPPVVAVAGTQVFQYAGVPAMNFSNYSTTCIDPSDGDLLWTYQGFANSDVDRQWCSAWAAFKSAPALGPVRGLK